LGYQPNIPTYGGRIAADLNARSAASKKEKDDGQNQADHKKDPCDVGSGARNTRKSENPGNQCYESIYLNQYSLCCHRIENSLGIGVFI
jgi:hypothetical protein